MKPLQELLANNKRLRVIGFDDAPFQQARGSPVYVAGVVCSATRFEGMVWGKITKDGTDATDTLSRLLLHSKFHAQVHVVLLDGIAVGGFNIINLLALSRLVQRPCIAVMRKHPDLDAIEQALRNLPDYQSRKASLDDAGIIHVHRNLYFQVSGCSPQTAALTLDRLTDTGHIPEALRLAHMIGSAVINGESANRA